MGQQLKFLFGHAVFAKRRLQIPNRLIKWFIGQFKSSPMNAHRMFRPYVLVNLYGLIRVDVLCFHEPAWFVSAHRDRAEIKRPEAFSNFVEIFAVTRVAREIKVKVWTFQGPPTPQ